MVVQISSRTASSSGVPRKAWVASSAPLLTPVTMSNSGRWPDSVQPLRKPAPNAPYCPPQESSKIFRACPRRLSSPGITPASANAFPAAWNMWRSGFSGS